MEKKYHATVSTDAIWGTTTTPSGSGWPNGSEGERDRERAIRALADYASLDDDMAAFFVDNIAANEAFAIGSDTVSWREIPVRRVVNEDSN